LLAGYLAEGEGECEREGEEVNARLWLLAEFSGVIRPSRRTESRDVMGNGKVGLGATSLRAVQCLAGVEA